MFPVSLKHLFKNLNASFSVWAVLLIIISVSISVVGFIELRDLTRERIYIASEKAARAKAEQFSAQVQISLDALDRVAAIYSVLGDINSSQLANSFNTELTYQQSIIGLVWLPKVAHAEINHFEQKLLKEIEQQIQIHVLTGHGAQQAVEEKQTYFPVRALYPTDVTELHLGLDVSSIPSRHRVMSKAFNSRSVSITDRLSIYTDGSLHNGFHAYHPIFSNNGIYDELTGYVVGIYEFDKLLKPLTSNLPMQMTLHDSSSQTQQLLFSSTAQYENVSAVLNSHQRQWSFPIKVADRQWMMTFFPDNELIENSARDVTPYIWLFTGTGLTALLALYFVISLLKIKQVDTLSEHLQIQQSLKKEAEMANQAKTNLLHAASHDLRQPLHTISLLSTLIQQSNNRVEQGKLLDRTLIAVESMQNLFSALLNIDQINSGQLNIQKSSFALGALLDSLFIRYELEAEQKGLKLKLVTTTVDVYTDPVLLESILSNLIGNAMRYTENGKVLVGCRRYSNRVRISVWDTGIGISELAQAHVLDEFYRDQAAKNISDSGLGLGLSIVAKLAQHLELEFGFQSRQGVGSHFYIEVPYAQQVKTETRTQSTQFNTHLGLAVWIIEDDNLASLTTTALLNSWGCMPKTVTDATELQVLLRQETTPPDVILADYQLHNETGLALIEIIQNHFNTEIPVLMITATVSAEVAASGYETLLKPLKSRQLNQWLTSQLSP